MLNTVQCYCTVQGRDHLIVHSSVVLKRGDEDDLVVDWFPVPFTLLGQIRRYLVRLASVSLTTCDQKVFGDIRNNF